MLGINLKHSLATLAVTAGVLSAAGPASAANHILYNGHAGLGAALTDGTSNTIMFGSKNEVAVESAFFLPEVNDEVLI